MKAAAQLSTAGPPQGANAPSGGRAATQWPTVGALIFDMDGTMIDSMPFHTKSWIEFARRHGLDIDMAELMRRTTGRTGTECMCEVFERDVALGEALALIHEKEAIYRELFAPVFAEVGGFRHFAAAAMDRGFKIGVGTAGDRHNIAFAFSHLKMESAPHAVVGGDEGLPGKPEPAIFLEAARRMGVQAQNCIVFEDAPFGIEAARRAGMRAVAICTSHDAQALAGSHVVAQVRDYHQLGTMNFLESLDA
jgi:beta-phosphoglucomutase-like phosphatase (HAD superfamily)